MITLPDKKIEDFHLIMIVELDLAAGQGSELLVDSLGNFLTKYLVFHPELLDIDLVRMVVGAEALLFMQQGSML